ncbi:Mid2 domain-containing protein [Madurella fahalii]|uniref:Mid2 domain-containing protein n=1 Tax=Madurella fahalii TaxID=1157608 RepID=A0ABQ0G3I0_9PEZI
MQLSRALELLVLGLSAISVAEATFINVNHGGSNVRALQQRQDDGDSSDAVTSTSSTPETTSTPPRTTSSSSSSPSSTSTPTDDSTSAPDPDRTTSSSSQRPPPSSTPPPEPSSDPSSSSSAPADDPEPTVITHFTTITSTNPDGSQTTLTSASVSTQTPGLADSGNSQSGMSPQTRDTVIGVVVGVGGAIILGGLALVAWRIWGRKKHNEENDVLMDYGSTVDKPDTGGSMSGRSPFQSTLESYHAPTQVNTAANF